MQTDVIADTFPYRKGRRWMKVYDTEDKMERKALMRDILTGYKAAVDFPTSMFVDDLIEMYPKAKVRHIAWKELCKTYSKILRSSSASAPLRSGESHSMPR